jgi:hypothetical protein
MVIWDGGILMDGADSPPLPHFHFQCCLYKNRKNNVLPEFAGPPNGLWNKFLGEKVVGRELREKVGNR